MFEARQPIDACPGPAAGAPRPAARSWPAAAAAVCLFAASLALFGLRDALILDAVATWPGAIPHAHSLLLHNHLQGWAHAGTQPLTLEYRWQSLAAAALWEWLPSLLFLAGLACLALRVIPGRNGGVGAKSRLASPDRQRETRVPGPLLAVAVALFVFVVAGAISTYAFTRAPHVQDSIAQLFQARIFASGRAWAPLPASPEFLSLEFLVEDGGRWYGQYPPGHAALLALGLLAGAPWLVNPLLGAFSALVVYAIARAAYGGRVAAMSAVLFGLSPFVWFMSGEFMNHASALLWGAIALWAAARAERAVMKLGRPPQLACYAAAGGAMLGLVALSRPLTALACGAPLALFWVMFPGPRRARLARGAAFAVALALALLPLFWFNAATTGDPLRFGYEARWGTSGLGFGSSQWGPPHTPARGLDQSWRNLDALNSYLFEWPVPSLLPLAGLWWLRRRLRRFDFLLAGWALSLLAVHFFYFYQDLCFGPRFLYEATPAVVILIARGIQGLGSGSARRWGESRTRAIRRVWGLALFCSAVGLAVNLPVLWKWYATAFWGVDARVAARLQRQLPRRAVVFVDDANRAREIRLLAAGVSPRVAHSAIVWLDDAWIDQVELESFSTVADPAAGALLENRLAAAAIRDRPQPRRTGPPWLDHRGPTGSFAQAFLGNTPDPARQRVIFALDLGPRNREFLAAYPGREGWRYAWDPETSAFRLTRLGASGAQFSRSPLLPAQDREGEAPAEP